MSEKLVQQVRLGKNSGLKISPILVGCMSYGCKQWAEWVLEDKEKIFSILKHCYDHGLRTFDTADVYSNGASERLVGEFLKKYNIDRETVVILTKLFYPVDESLDLKHGGTFDEEEKLQLTHHRGLSRKHIIAGAKASMERLGTYIDVLQIHRFDDETPMEETMRALNYVVDQGFTRYIGASTMRATEFAEMQFIAEKHGWYKFISSQSSYNLLYREDERELIPFAQRHGVGLIPWSPNARGVLTRPSNQTSERIKSDPTYSRLGWNALRANQKEIVDRVEEIAKTKGVSMAVISIAWVLSKGAYPIVGLNSIERVNEALQALDVRLTDEETTYLEEKYLPVKPM